MSTIRFRAPENLGFGYFPHDRQLHHLGLSLQISLHHAEMNAAQGFYRQAPRGFNCKVVYSRRAVTMGGQITLSFPGVHEFRILRFVMTESMQNSFLPVFVPKCFQAVGNLAENHKAKVALCLRIVISVVGECPFVELEAFVLPCDSPEIATFCRLD